MGGTGAAQAGARQQRTAGNAGRAALPSPRANLAGPAAPALPRPLPPPARPRCARPWPRSAPPAERHAPTALENYRKKERTRNQIPLAKPSPRAGLFLPSEATLYGTHPSPTPPRHLSLSSSPQGDPFLPPDAHTRSLARLPPSPGPYRAPRRLPEGKAAHGPLSPCQPCTHLPETSCLCSRRRRRHRPSSSSRAASLHRPARRRGLALPPACALRRSPTPTAEGCLTRSGGDAEARPSSRTARTAARAALPSGPAQETATAAAARPLLPHPARPPQPPARMPAGPGPAAADGAQRGRRAWPGLRRRRLRAEGEDEEAVRAALPPLSSMNGAAGPPRNPGSSVPRRSGAAGVPPGDKMAAAGLRPVTSRVCAPPDQIGGGSFLEVRRWIGLRKMNELSRGREPSAQDGGPLASPARAQYGGGPQRSYGPLSISFLRGRGTFKCKSGILQKAQRWQGNCTETASHGLRWMRFKYIYIYLFSSM